MFSWNETIHLRWKYLKAGLNVSQKLLKMNFFLRWVLKRPCHTKTVLRPSHLLENSTSVGISSMHHLCHHFLDWRWCLRCPLGCWSLWWPWNRCWLYLDSYCRPDNTAWQDLSSDRMDKDRFYWSCKIFSDTRWNLCFRHICFQNQSKPPLDTDCK